MSLAQISILIIIGTATVVGWSLLRGATLFRLYWLALLVLAGLIVAAAGQIMAVRSVAETAILFAITFSFAGWASSPTLWRNELRRDLESTVLYARFEPRDLRSWRAWLKLVDRWGAATASLAYVAILLAPLAAAAATVQPTGPANERTPMMLALVPVAIFALLSAWYLYRGARRLVPGA